MRHLSIVALALCGCIILTGCGTPTENVYGSVETTESTKTPETSTALHADLESMIPSTEDMTGVEVLLDTAWSYQLSADALSEEEYNQYIFDAEDMGWVITSQTDGIAYAKKDNMTLCVQRVDPIDQETFIHVYRPQ